MVVFWENFPKNARPRNNQGKCFMRISEDRYSRERLCLQVALRFLEHEARTQTIRTWTGLSDDRIRKLYRSYMTRARRYVPRHRGKSPHQVAYFARSIRVQQETVWLASLLSLLGVIPPEPSADGTHAMPNVARGELLCHAFETYREMIPSSQISFEHAVFLVTTLSRGEQLRLGGCTDCGSLVVTERFPIREKRCHHCVASLG
jgi:hypothetical protein